MITGAGWPELQAGRGCIYHQTRTTV